MVHMDKLLFNDISNPPSMLFDRDRDAWLAVPPIILGTIGGTNKPFRGEGPRRHNVGFVGAEDAVL